MKLLNLLNIILLFETFLCDENCGGIFSGFQYHIQSPNYPKNYPANKNCVYTLKGSEFANCDQDFHLQFLDFELEVSEKCEKDYVKIGTGNHVFCGKNVGIHKFTGENKSLKLTFHSDTTNTTTAKGFKILVTTLSCANSNSNVSNDFVEETTIVTKNENEFPGLKNPSENLQLPEFEQHNFHDKNCGHSYTLNDDGIGSITSYLYLPHAEINNKPLKISEENEAALNSETETIPNEISSTRLEFQSHRSPITNVAESPPTDVLLPYHQIPTISQFRDEIFIPQTRNTFQPSKSPQINDSKYRHSSSNRWITYGTPNSPSPSIPNDSFDPFANNNNNNNDPGMNYNPVSSGCGGNTNNPNNNNNNNNNGNWNWGINPGENFGPRPNVNNYNPNSNPNYGNDNFDLSFDANGNNDNNNNNNNNFATNNNFYGTDTVDTSTYYGEGSSECCGTRYSGNNFLLASPGFPALIYSSRTYDCQYTIVRSSQNVCALQMYLKFFNFGSEDQFCAYGYVEIDGRRLCGCKTGMNVTSSFDNIATKTINVKYLGYPRIKFSGFVIEVTQVSCSTNFVRVRNYEQNQNPYFVRSFQRNYKRSAISVAKNPKEEIKENEKGAEKDLRRKREAGYFYERPNSAAFTSMSENLFLNSCRIFKFLNWVKAAKQVYLRSAQCSKNTGTTVSSIISVIPIFPDTGNSALINFPSSSNCESVNIVEGTISSPYYPNSYANNLNQCYRFFKAPGFCQIELAMLDFDLENSTFCRKDYVAFSGQKRRYCGSSLTGSRTIFDMTNSPFADLYFVSDSSASGRGFRAGFTQISC